MSFTQYLKDTRGELHHVAWPTRLQTIVYTILVVALSVGIALYLGFFDFVFTTGLARALVFLPHKAPITVTTSSTTPLTITPIPVQAAPSAPAAPQFNTKLPTTPTN